MTWRGVLFFFFKKNFNCYQLNCENLKSRVPDFFHTAWLAILHFACHLFETNISYILFRWKFKSFWNVRCEFGSVFTDIPEALPTLETFETFNERHTIRSQKHQLNIHEQHCGNLKYIRMLDAW